MFLASNENGRCLAKDPSIVNQETKELSFRWDLPLLSHFSMWGVLGLSALIKLRLQMIEPIDELGGQEG